MKIIKRLSVYIMLYLCVCLFLFMMQRDLIYFPTHTKEHHFKTEFLLMENSKIEVLKLNQGNQKSIVYFGGNAENLAYTALEIGSHFPNHTIYLMNYPGYGNSTGNPSESSILEAASKLYAMVNSQHKSITVMGRSLGTGVATFIAANHLIEKLVLITPFDSLLEVAKDKFFMFPIKLLLKDSYQSILRSNQIKAQTLILIAENDEVIPKQNSMNLVNSFEKNLVEYRIIGNSTHNNISDHFGYFKVLKEFLEG